MNRGRIGQQGQAEDLLQDVYLAALQGIGRFRGRTHGEFIVWLLRIAHAMVADHLRRRYRHPEVTLPDLGIAVDTQATLDWRQELREISAALGRLTDDQREVVLMRHVVGMDLMDTARALGKNVGSVKALHHRALAALSRILAEGDRYGH
jgi:RNA polymerase sigma-70 factor, ECF subfamily